MPLLYFILLFFHYLSITLSQRKRDKTEKRNAGYANCTLISSDMTNAFNQITQAAILETVTSQFGLGVHANVLGVLQGPMPGTQAHIAGLWWTGMDGAMRSYVHDCGG